VTNKNLLGSDRFSSAIASDDAEISIAGDGTLGEHVRALKFTSGGTFGAKQLKINTNNIFETYFLQNK